MIRPLDRLMDRLFRVPFLPLPAGPLAVLFPFLWYLALPARMIFVIGEPIDVAALAREAGIEDLDDPGREEIRRLTDAIRDRMQERLTRLVERYGRWPYQCRLLARELWRRRRHWFQIGPWGWVWCFSRHARDRQRPPARNRLHALLRDWDLLLYYLPLGWPLLALARRLRKPPCGYRGLTPRSAASARAPSSGGWRSGRCRPPRRQGRRPPARATERLRPGRPRPGAGTPRRRIGRLAG